MALDVTDLPASAVRRDQMVTLIGDGLSLDEVAAQAGTICYEVLTSLGRRYPPGLEGLSSPAINVLEMFSCDG